MSLPRRIFLGAAGLRAWAQEPTTFRTEVKLVRLLATVKDANGGLVGGLTKADFRISDNGAPQDVTVFEQHTEQPLSVAIMLDISGSTGKDLKYEIDSLRRFAQALFGSGNPSDQAALYTFNHEVARASAFTRRLNVLERAMRGLKAEAGTSLYDAILLGADQFDGRHGRHVMVVVTDGGDTTSSTTYHDALEAAHRNDVLIYSILVVPIENDAGRNIGGEHALEHLAASTGGKVFQPTIGTALDKAFDAILRDLRTQYLLGYYPKNVPLTRNRFHTVKVDTATPGLRVQTRSGYYGDAIP
ncbi:MAG: VWA domain-containing protein [Planctomycetaceae bacterium]|nr:VWA domain-containing protein [Planctomycetaceae bacterium]